MTSKSWDSNPRNLPPKPLLISIVCVCSTKVLALQCEQQRRLSSVCQEAMHKNHAFYKPSITLHLDKVHMEQGFGDIEGKNPDVLFVTQPLRRLLGACGPGQGHWRECWLWKVLSSDHLHLPPHMGMTRSARPWCFRPEQCLEWPHKIFPFLQSTLISSYTDLFPLYMSILSHTSFCLGIRNLLNVMLRSRVPKR